MPLITGLDIETTGLEQADGHRIVEICCRCYDMATRQLKLNYVQRINPERPIQASAQAVHGIFLADLAGKPLWPAVAPQVRMILAKSAVVVAHNGYEFDLPFVGMEMIRIGIKPPTNFEVFDTMVEGRWATPWGKLPSLKELCFACDIEYDESKAHAADYDVDVMMQAFFKGRDWGFFKLDLTEEKEAA